ncbi:MAG: glycosyltransferase [Haloechinothrix sp.]
MTCSERVWVDATDIVTWHQHKTGTQRAVADIIAAYASLRGIRLFCYSQRWQRFFALRTDDVLAMIGPSGSGGSGRERRRPKRVADFGPGDHLLMLGGDWRRRGFLPRLARLRSRIGVRLHHFVHDVMPITTPHLFPPHETVDCLHYLSRAFRILDSVVTSSAWNVMQIADLVAAGRLAEVPLQAVGLGTTSLLCVPPQRPLVDLPDEFALSVGTFELKKNRRAIYQVYRLATATDRLAPLVIAGQPGGLPDQGIHLLRLDPALSGRVWVLTDVDDSQLVWLYRHCAYTIYGSLAEGWGIPIDESLSFGAPCLCSTEAAMPEVAGDAACYFNPYDPDSLLALLRQAADPATLARWRQQITSVYRPRTWVDIAQAIDAWITR